MHLEVLHPNGGPFTDYLGLTWVEVTGSKVVATWTAGERHHQPYGIVHGGVHASVVETVASVGAGSWFGERGSIVGVSNSTDFFKAVREGEMTSTGVPVHQGRSQQLWVVETRDEDGRLVSRGQLRVQNIPR
jgi:1,4-dihydroxy-2-naphthoyl-CoA hydrolase